jgi:hypothetical protein
MSNDLHVDDERTGLPETGIYVRADGGSFDIAHLTRDSVLRWLRSRGGSNLWAENTVLVLIGWPQYSEAEALAALKETQP